MRYAERIKVKMVITALQLQYAIVGTRFQKDFSKYMVGGNLILPRICMWKKALKTGCM